VIVPLCEDPVFSLRHSGKFLQFVLNVPLAVVPAAKRSLNNKGEK